MMLRRSSGKHDYSLYDENSEVHAKEEMLIYTSITPLGESALEHHLHCLQNHQNRYFCIRLRKKQNKEVAPRQSVIGANDIIAAGKTSDSLSVLLGSFKALLILIDMTNEEEKQIQAKELTASFPEHRIASSISILLYNTTDTNYDQPVRYVTKILKGVGGGTYGARFSGLVAFTDKGKLEEIIAGCRIIEREENEEEEEESSSSTPPPPPKKTVTTAAKPAPAKEEDGCVVF